MKRAKCFILDGEICFADEHTYTIQLPGIKTAEDVLALAFHLNAKIWMRKETLSCFIRVVCQELEIRHTAIEVWIKTEAAKKDLKVICSQANKKGCFIHCSHKIAHKSVGYGQTMCDVVSIFCADVNKQVKCIPRLPESTNDES